MNPGLVYKVKLVTWFCQWRPLLELKVDSWSVSPSPTWHVLLVKEMGHDGIEFGALFR